jgi:hypothetical protein
MNIIFGNNYVRFFQMRIFRQKRVHISNEAYIVFSAETLYIYNIVFQGRSNFFILLQNFFSKT